MFKASCAVFGRWTSSAASAGSHSTAPSAYFHSFPSPFVPTQPQEHVAADGRQYRSLLGAVSRRLDAASSAALPALPALRHARVVSGELVERRRGCQIGPNA